MEITKQKLRFYRYIYVSDIIDHEIDVFERKDREQLVYVKVRKMIQYFGSIFVSLIIRSTPRLKLQTAAI